MKYDIFYDVLLNLREEFHRNGRFDDSNVKLDEIIKLLTISFYEAKSNTGRFNLSYLEDCAEEKFGDKNKIAAALKALFNEVVKDEMFFNNDGSNIFGENPSLSIQDSEDTFAIKLVLELGKIDFTDAIHSNSAKEFDLINECFGHFVRDNFRHNKEDAQYMTPKEIVNPVLDIIVSDLLDDPEFIEKLFGPEPVLILDPTCGVGTLVIEVIRYLINFIEESDYSIEEKEFAINKLKNSSLIGQDKVDRMVRLSKINAMFMGCNFNQIYLGNSILDGSMLDNYLGKIDLIITNPPFGANYGFDEILGSPNYDFSKRLESVNLPSEILLFDRSIQLLKENGKMAIVIPDSVVSSKGMQSKFRELLLEYCTIKAVLDLPGVTFAQAGTRTKTVIVYLEKRASENSDIFMGVADSIGFDVKERKGVPVKFDNGNNDMVNLSSSYISSKYHGDTPKVILSEPSATRVSRTDLIDNFLTPSFYDSKRLEIVNLLNGINQEVAELVKLEDVATLDSKSRKRKKLLTDENTKHISLLHINNDCTINFEEVEKFAPISKGTECYEGEVLFAKLNPRIPRIAVVPRYNKKLVCSNEFEVLVPKDGISPYLLMNILNSDIVKNQIQSLTAGTSSSHNRIKSEQLKDIMIPLPKKHSDLYKELNQIAEGTEEAIKLKYKATSIMAEQLYKFNSLI